MRTEKALCALKLDIVTHCPHGRCSVRPVQLLVLRSCPIYTVFASLLEGVYDDTTKSREGQLVIEGSCMPTSSLLQ
jgi:rhodanese-related sulfurtransferase